MTERIRTEEAGGGGWQFAVIAVALLIVAVLGITYCGNAEEQVRLEAGAERCEETAAYLEADDWKYHTAREVCYLKQSGVWDAAP